MARQAVCGVGLLAGSGAHLGAAAHCAAQLLQAVRHIANVATVSAQSRERATAFPPGQGRAVFVGAPARF